MPTRICASGASRPVAGGHRAREQADRDAKLTAERLDGQEVLLGERLGRRHERAPEAALGSAQQRVQRDDRLAGADVTLQQAFHRRRPGEIGVDLRDRALLVIGELEGQERPVADGELPRLAERRCGLALTPAAPACEAELEHQELIEGQPPPAFLRLGERHGLVQRAQRVRARRKPLGRAQSCGKWVPLLAGDVQRGGHELADPLRRQVLGRRVDRGEVGRSRLAVQVVGLDGEAVAPERSAQPDSRPGLELLGEPSLVEPGRLDLARAVRDAGLDEREPSARPPETHAAHLAGDRHLLLGRHLGNRPLGHRQLIAMRPMLEDVADRAQAQPVELLRHRGTHPRERLHSPLEHVGARRHAWARPA